MTALYRFVLPLSKFTIRYEPPRSRLKRTIGGTELIASLHSSRWPD